MRSIPSAATAHLLQHQRQQHICARVIAIALSLVLVIAQIPPAFAFVQENDNMSVAMQEEPLANSNLTFEDQAASDGDDNSKAADDESTSPSNSESNNSAAESDTNTIDAESFNANADDESANAEDESTDANDDENFEADANEDDVILSPNSASSTEQETTAKVVFDLSGIKSGFAPVMEIDGVEYSMSVSGSKATVTLPAGKKDVITSAFATVYRYNKKSSDTHTVYPTEMYVWKITYNEKTGIYTTKRLSAFDNILTYAGCSIRAVGTKGIRLVTSVPADAKESLTSSGLAGYTLEEYGTIVQWDSKLGDTVLTRDNTTLQGTAYKRSTGADPIYKQDDTTIKYTNVLVGFTDEQSKNDLSMRPYMILKDSNGKKLTLYGGIVHRSVGYVASQNANAFGKGTAGYRFIWDIIHAVYGNKLNNSLGYVDWDIREHVPEIMQYPELPWGCESVALCIDLTAMGYDLEKTEIYDYYLSHSDWDWVYAYAGDAVAMTGMGCCMPPAIVDAANRYLSEHNAAERAVNISGSSFDTLLEYIDQGYPVILWSTIYMYTPRFYGMVQDGYEVYSNIHCLVMYDYDDDYAYVSDSLSGKIARDRYEFASLYETCGRNAVVII